MDDWIDVPGFPGYEYTSLGLVRSWRNVGGGRRLVPRLVKQQPSKEGYPRVGIYRDGKQVWIFVHHLVLERKSGPRPEGMEARHKNGVASDVSPDNLEWSTHLDNVSDQLVHGTRRRGSEKTMAKLDEPAVLSIYNRLRNGERAISLAAEYGVSLGLIGHIKRGRAWKHVVAEPLPVRTAQPRHRPGKPFGARHANSKLSDETVRQALSWIADGIAQHVIAARLGVSQGCISSMRRGLTWKHVVR